MKKVTISDKCLETYPWMKFGYCFVKNISWGDSSDFLREKQKEAADLLLRTVQGEAKKPLIIP